MCIKVSYAQKAGFAKLWPIHVGGPSCQMR
jgi:hypothetical protein